MSESSRPSGVTILVVLEVISSVAFLVAGAGTLALTAALGAFFPALGGYTGFVGGVLLLLGLAGLAVAWGLWTGQSWAWTLTLVLAAIGILTGLFSLPGSILGILINFVIVYYLYRPHVKEYFGK